MRLLELYERMLLIRETETRLRDLFNDGKIPGFIHLSIGQEATAVGVMAALDREDTIASTHRGHGHALAKGMRPEALLQEILGHEEGVCRGRGGSLHVADFSIGMLGANGIVAAGVPIALGSALAHKTLGTSRVAVAFFGDGALAEGVFYETLNLASLWKLPLLLVCENNGWSEFSPVATQYAGSVTKLCASFDLRYQQVDGNDVEAVHEAASTLVAALRRRQGPALLECMTKRVEGHYAGDPQKYRQGVPERAAEDPLDHARARLRAGAIADEAIDAVARRVRQEVDAASAASSRGREPAFAAAAADVYAQA
jgi:pyruvate dehydrogenase E1 component alpha subunit